MLHTLLLFVICTTWAAPVTIERSKPVQLRHRGSGYIANQHSKRSGSPRQWNVLYPHPRGGEPYPQSPLQELPQSSETLPMGTDINTVTSSSTSSSQPTSTDDLGATPSTGLSQTTVSPSSAPNVPRSSVSSISTGLPQTSASSSSVFGLTSLEASSSTRLPQSTASGSPPAAPSTEAPLQLSLVNNLNSDNAHAYVSALDASGRVVMLTPSGSFYYLPETGSDTPLAISADIAIPLPARGQSLQIAIPAFVEGARVWFADGTLDFAVVNSINGPALVEPTASSRDDASAATNWGFVELAWVAGYGLFANLSFVDFLGLPLALQLQTLSNGTQTVPGVPTNAVQQVCDRLRQHGGKGARYWNDLCVLDSSGSPMRVISPAVLLSQQPDGFPSFFQRYVDRVWERYTMTTLTINTQNDNGNVACRVVGDEMQCDGDSRGYAKPSASDIFGCNSGPFGILESDNAVHRAVVPRLCAAFNRGTLMLEGGDVQPALPPSSYYTSRPHNLYSAVLHEVELEGRGYAFSYDDVAPTAQEGVAGTVAAADPQLLTVFIGGM